MGFHFYYDLQDSLSAVNVQLYSPRRPAVDVAEVFLWLMAVGTILCASYWSAWNAREAAIEYDKMLKVLHHTFRGLFFKYLKWIGQCNIIRHLIRFWNS